MLQLLQVAHLLSRHDVLGGGLNSSTVPVSGDPGLRPKIFQGGCESGVGISLTAQRCDPCFKHEGFGLGMSV